MPPTPVRHVRVPDQLWDAAKARAESEYRNVSDVIVECLRRYTQADGSPPVGTGPANGRSPVPTPALQARDGGPGVGTANTGGPPVVGTAGNGKAAAVPTEGGQARDAAAAVPTPAPRKRKPPKVTTAAELSKPPEERQEAVLPGMAPAAPKPRRCTHPGFRSTGGFCPDCDHLVGSGGYWK